MLNFKGIDHINMNVENLKSSIKFYKEIFGFEVKESGVSAKSGNDYAIIGKSGQGMLALYQVDEFKLQGNLNHLGFNVESLIGIEKYFSENNIPMLYGGGVVSYPDSESIYIADPNGYEIEISNNFGGGL